VFVAVKMVLATTALFVPAFLMGGTLPLLAHAFVASREEFGKTGSVIYAANTFGAVVGALAVPFLLLPTLGAERSYFAAVAANLCVGVSAILLDSSERSAREPAADETRRVESRKREGVRAAGSKTSEPKTSRSKPAWLLSFAAFLSGALVLALSKRLQQHRVGSVRNVYIDIDMEEHGVLESGGDRDRSLSGQEVEEGDSIL